MVVAAPVPELVALTLEQMEVVERQTLAAVVAVDIPEPVGPVGPVASSSCSADL